MIMKVASLSFLILSTFSQSRQKLTKNNLYLEETRKITSDGKVSFSLVGDWGGDQTTGDLTQLNLNISKSLDKTAPILDTDFLLLLGDNFYDIGVQNLNSDRFDQNFQGMFHSGLENLKDMPMWTVAGNHDYKGNVSAQILYTDYDPTGRWRYPHFWYKLPTYSTSAFSLDIIVIDTELMCFKFSVDEIEDLKIDTIEAKWNFFYQQLDWFENALATSTADYIVVAGHKQILSTADHHLTEELMEWVLPLLKKYGVQLYVSGHEHQLQAYREDYYNRIEEKMSALRMVISGASHTLEPNENKSIPRYDTQELFWAEHGAYGHVIVDSEGLKIFFIDAESNELIPEYFEIMPKRIGYS